MSNMDERFAQTIVKHPDELRKVIDGLWNINPKELAAAAQYHEMRTLLQQLDGCAAALRQRIDLEGRRSKPFLRPTSPGPAARWAHTMGAGLQELARGCLCFADALGLARARLLSRQWRVWAEADELWRPLTMSRWHGTAALDAAGAVSDGFMSLYLRRCHLERNKAASTSLSTNSAALDIGNYSLLVELSCGSESVLHKLLDLAVVNGGVGLEARVDPSDVHTPSISEEPATWSLSLTVLRRSDKKLMRVCLDADIYPEGSSEVGGEPYVPFQIGGDASDGLMHPALWSIVSDVACHHVALTGVQWDNNQANDNQRISGFGSIFIGLWDPRELLIDEAAFRVLTVWEEVGEWI
eukprot:TRINITY_DN37420_c0_g1_i1.p1 TRINITY_DN37420_c0_g1~~TRINITY_DN37420_c0_g1_i1.p1  ORF type:complete len:367 (+),score=54.34 TRINITY_DN37420_c0_g1_i1:41-1102(+)